MARSIQDFDGVLEPIDSDYPDGDIKDKSTGGPGTKINRKSNADIQQFFAKLMRMAQITPNSLPDNEYNMFQLVEAAFILGRGGWITQLVIPDLAQNTTIDTSQLELVTYGPGADPSHNLYLDASSDDRGYIQVKVINNSPEIVTVYDFNSGTVNGGATFSLPGYASRLFYLDGTNWIVG